ncbi:MAG: ABC transporter substrate-binding protein [Bradyrhizobium sp.]|uniref:ABC transporter substrate-binding protein n=1 Tax=Bradyrhizobium sp. TaxID=376 RepID=UPI001C297AC7|nr:ABC transporter substrate-binding protein [Bradyrhizobium sp.]MBU6462317.1 ABC transporter substrate-binding protein [Pseudomonadota bacterium]MDE2067369.1 ABC transporter substrate-binding protein [Bradyrhizobium sp.]MDE2242751.1 ABC transporter substrate-binding protein [Bradyrhizobium sp.]MDE2468631.1 ABC transporter substrate-binding protein [Bradyrhizobium sp.]
MIGVAGIGFDHRASSDSTPDFSGGRIVVLPPLITNFALVSHAANRVSGTSPAGLMVLRREILARIFPSLLDMPLMTDSSYAPNLEMMLAARPAIIFASAQAAEMRRLGLNVADLAAHQGAEPMARLFLKGIGKADWISGAIDEFHRRQASLDDELSTTCADDRKPRVLILGIYSGADLISGGALSPFNEIIAHAGGENALADMHVNVARLDPEALLTLDPDVLVFGEGVDAYGLSPSQIMKNPKFRPLHAIARKQIYQQPNMWSVPNSLVELPIYERWLAELLHPCLSKKTRKMVADAYRAASGQDLSEELIDIELSVAPNLNSAEGTRFSRTRAD